jgi:hypothetical protein
MLAATWFTGAGTLLVAVAAVWVALWSDARASRRVADERANSAADLAAEQAHSAEMLAREQEFSRGQLVEERQLALDREQFAEACQVQVVQAEAWTKHGPEPYNEPDPSVRALVAIVVNHGAYVITRVEAQFHLHSNSGGSFVGRDRTEWLSGFADLPEGLQRGLAGAPEYSASLDRLAPWDVGIRFQTDSIATKFTLGWYPVVRWTDRWATGGSTPAGKFTGSTRTRPGLRDIGRAPSVPLGTGRVFRESGRACPARGHAASVESRRSRYSYRVPSAPL